MHGITKQRDLNVYETLTKRTPNSSVGKHFNLFGTCSYCDWCSINNMYYLCAFQVVVAHTWYAAYDVETVPQTFYTYILKI